jgi:potassium-transporting ATPase KdpC subunit
MKILRPCLVITALLLLACCVLYPALVTVASAALFPRQARGSLLEADGQVLGSALIGQTLDKPLEHLEYFWGRPSAASVDGATGVLVSGGSNQGPSSAALAADVKARAEMLRRAGVTGALPVDLVTRSAGGLDPHISAAGAAVQVPRVAKARGLSEAEVGALVAAHTKGRSLGLLGEARVNVLELNLALDAKKHAAPVALTGGSR